MTTGHVASPTGSARLSHEAFQRVSSAAHAFAGLQIPTSKTSLVQSRLSKRLRALGLNDFDTYLDFLDTSDGQTERALFVSALTTNVTQFFREPHHFEALEKTYLPALLQRAQHGGRVRIWSAGCSSGQEPYSLASLILRLDPSAGSLNIRILATDIDRQVLQNARSAQYPATGAESLPLETRRALFASAPENANTLSIRPDVAGLVTFRELNLVGHWPLSGPFDAIFCRNVVIYFSEDTQRALWPRFASVLAAGAPLFLGHSERIAEPKRLGLTPSGVTTYLRKSDISAKSKHPSSMDPAYGLA